MCLMLSNNSFATNSAVTYTLSGGRLGDNLLAYCHAKWISHKYQIPLLYLPFPYSDQLIMHLLEEPLSQESFCNYKNIVNIAKVTSYTIDPDSNTLYIIPYFSESIIERSYRQFFFYFPTEWDDIAFKVQLKKMICPRVFLNIVKPPKDCVSIALHVRVGTGFDIPSLKDYECQTAQGTNQLKFPPFSYYHKQLKRLVDVYSDQKIYIYVFTDHTYPQEIAEEFKKILNCERATFDYRKQTIDPNLCILEDFFSMQEFDCLIRPDANFSFIASRIGVYDIQISPWHCSLIHDEYVMDQICINTIVYSEI